MNIHTGKFIMIAGAFLLILGLIIYLFHDKLNWIGRLPGDIRIERENFRLYFPLTTMILASLIINLLLRIIRKFFESS